MSQGSVTPLVVDWRWEVGFEQCHMGSVNPLVVDWRWEVGAGVEKLCLRDWV